MWLHEQFTRGSATCESRPPKLSLGRTMLAKLEYLVVEIPVFHRCLFSGQLTNCDYILLGQNSKELGQLVMAEEHCGLKKVLTVTSQSTKGWSFSFHLIKRRGDRASSCRGDPKTTKRVTRVALRETSPTSRMIWSPRSSLLFRADRAMVDGMAEEQLAQTHHQD